MLERVKLALLISGNDFDSELMDDINAAAKDLGIAGVALATIISQMISATSYTVW